VHRMLSLARAMLVTGRTVVPPVLALPPLALTLLAATVPAAAQDFRGTIQGRITDASSGAVPGATVTASHTETNVAASAVTDADGNYSLPFLAPGPYRLTIELTGFKKVERRVDVRIGDRLGLDFALEVGGVEEIVTVSSATPLLDTRSGSAGQVIDEKRIAMMPLSDGNPFVLARLAPGVAYTGDLLFSRPFDNGGTSGIVSDGASGGNEFTLDGSPNMTGRRVAFVPPAGAIQEFKVETANFDAQQGHTGGATINVTMKSGTNRLKGEGYYQYRDEKFSNNDFFLERAGRPKDNLDYKRYGGTLGGPVNLGNLYNGRDRTFFFAAVEWLYDVFPEPDQYTVPTEQQRRGDFSDLLAQGIRIYDPATAFINAQGRVERLPFENNIIPESRINPIAREYLKYYPLPNQAGDATGRDNYLASNNRGDDFYSVSTRIDHQISASQKVFGRYTRNRRTEYRGNWTGEVNGIRPTGNFLYRNNDGLNIDHVWTISSGSLLNLRGGWSRFQEPSRRQHQGEFDATSLGFPPAVSALFSETAYFPRFAITTNTDPTMASSYDFLGDSFAGGTDTEIYSFQPTWTAIRGNHSVRTGYDYRVYREQQSPSLQAAGRYDFSGDFTRQFDNAANAPIGQELAAFMLGQPTNGFIDRSTDRFSQVQYHGVFVQDDWKVSNTLTVNLGLRYEYEGAPTERFNRNVRGFDPDAELAITNAAQAAYAASPLAELPASQFRVRGGLQFASSDQRGFYTADKNNFQPRIGFAYQADSKTVVRGGFALYTVPAIVTGSFPSGVNQPGVFQPGFSQATTLVPTLDNGLTFRGTLSNPFPDGVREPPGASLGPNTFLGRTLTRHFANIDARSPQSMRFVLSMQRELPGQWVVEATYVGNRGYDQPVEIDLNAVPAQYLSTSPIRDDATINFLTQQVPNPFRGLLPGENLNSATVQRQQLLRPFPQFNEILAYAYDGKNWYDSAQFRVEHRFAAGYTVLASYTYSRLTEQSARLNISDTGYDKRIARDDIPHRLVLNGIWELPFGRGRAMGANVGRLTDAFIGGWNIAATWQVQSGRPMDLSSNLFYDGDLRGLTADYSGSVDRPVFDVSRFYFHDALVQTNGQDDPTKQRNDRRIQLANNIRTVPFRVASLRGPHLNDLSLSFVKSFQIAGRARAQLHFELYNALNQVVYAEPNRDPRNSNFGKVTSQANLPRNFQIGTKIIF